MNEQVYDVAISFLSRDLAVGRALAEALSANLVVFLYERSQEEVAGTDGLESFRTVFRNRSTLNVILFREGYGETPWTRVEVTAIQERALKDGWQTVLLAAIEGDYAPPRWFPSNRITSSVADYGVPGVAAVVLARAREAGAPDRRETPAELAARLERAARDQERRRTFEHSEDGVEAAKSEYNAIFATMESEVGKIASLNPKTPLRAGRKPDQIMVNAGRVSVSVYWEPQYSNTLEGSALIALSYDGRLDLPGSTGRFVDAVRKVGQRVFYPSLAADDHLVWTDRDSRQTFTSSNLAEDLLSSLIRRAYAAPGA